MIDSCKRVPVYKSYITMKKDGSMVLNIYGYLIKIYLAVVAIEQYYMMACALFYSSSSSSSSFTGNSGGTTERGTCSEDTLENERAPELAN